MVQETIHSCCGTGDSKHERTAESIYYIYYLYETNNVYSGGGTSLNLFERVEPGIFNLRVELVELNHQQLGSKTTRVTFIVFSKRLSG